MDLPSLPEAYQTNAARWGGALVGIGSFATVGIIALFLSAGGPNLVGASGEGVATVLSDSPTELKLVGILSIPANLMVIIGAFMLTQRRPHAPGPVPVAAMWYGVAIAFLLVMLYDLALPFLLVPLAAQYASYPLIFDGLYQTFDFGHSVGLLVTFAALTLVFWGEAHHPSARLPQAWAYVAAGASALGIVLSSSFLAGSPFVFLAPSTFVIWISLGVLGARIAMHGP